MNEKIDAAVEALRSLAKIPTTPEQAQLIDIFCQHFDAITEEVARLEDECMEAKQEAKDVHADMQRICGNYIESAKCCDKQIAILTRTLRNSVLTFYNTKGIHPTEAQLKVDMDVDIAQATAELYPENEGE